MAFSNSFSTQTIGNSPIYVSAPIFCCTNFFASGMPPRFQCEWAYYVTHFLFSPACCTSICHSKFRQLSGNAGPDGRKTIGNRSAAAPCTPRGACQYTMRSKCHRNIDLKVALKVRSGFFVKLFSSGCFEKSKLLKNPFNHRSNSSGRIHRASFLKLRMNGAFSCTFGALSFTLW